MLRIGGVAYLTFDPIWTADTGSHFSHYVKEPWAHLLQSTDEFAANMRKAGAAEWEVSDFILWSEPWVPCSEYKKRLHDVLGSAGLKRYAVDSWSGCVDPASVRHPNSLRACSALRCAEDDLWCGVFTSHCRSRAPNCSIFWFRKANWSQKQKCRSVMGSRK